MNRQYPQIKEAKVKLEREYSKLKNKKQILRSPIFRNLFSEIKLLNDQEKKGFGQELNKLKIFYENKVFNIEKFENKSSLIDVSSPLENNFNIEKLYLNSADLGSIHPLSKEIDYLIEIFYGLGFNVVESFEIDDDYHMFSSLNFPDEHPARDDFDTFSLKQKDSKNKNLVAPAHTSSMQNRILQKYKNDLIDRDYPIACIVPGRVFRHEDVDARHEHTFYQLEGIYVAKEVSVANLMGTLKTVMNSYFNKNLNFTTQPFYFPFTEPSFEMAVGCPYCFQEGCRVCSYSGWIELLGCGMVHPNVLRMGGIDPNTYSGFAFGIGIMRMTMIKYNIEDIRHFLSSKLNFLRQFK